jgi:SAM-dependent methyltransferase
MTVRKKTPDEIRETVREGYGKIAVGEELQPGSKSAGGCCGPSTSGCSPGTDPAAFAQSVGYTAEEVAALPEGTNMGLSCGNPAVIASLKKGEVVLDLGAGGGMDAFLAGPKVGAEGRVIGVDMTAEMVAKARRNAAAYSKRSGLENVEFRLGEIEHLPVADASVDVVISNCVLNLSPDKPQVWREIARVLKPGGRVAVSDLALLRELPAEVVESVEALVGCVAGAVLVSDTELMMRAAGLIDVQLRAKPEYVRSVMSFEDPLYQRIVERLPQGTTPADFITSLDVQGRKGLAATKRASSCC